jgi:hypothetical protein
MEVAFSKNIYKSLFMKRVREVGGEKGKGGDRVWGTIATWKQCL